MRADEHGSEARDLGEAEEVRCCRQWHGGLRWQGSSRCIVAYSKQSTQALATLCGSGASAAREAPKAWWRTRGTVTTTAGIGTGCCSRRRLHPARAERATGRGTCACRWGDVQSVRGDVRKPSHQLRTVRGQHSHAPCPSWVGIDKTCGARKDSHAPLPTVVKLAQPVCVQSSSTESCTTQPCAGGCPNCEQHPMCVHAKLACRVTHCTPWAQNFLRQK